MEAEGPVDFDKALKRIVQTSNADSLLAKGLHEVCKAIEQPANKMKAQYVILAQNCNDATYVKLVKGLAANNKVPVYEIEKGETLGEWLDLCKRDKQKSIVKQRKCSSIAIKDFSGEIKEEEKVIFKNKFS